MKNKRVKLPKKYKKGAYEAKFEEMVKEYHSAQAVLGEMSVGSEEYTEQKILCDKLFAHAERFFKQNQ
ncbi:hypothetical protein E8L98_06955 [Vibrio cholerae]|nr:hypothetical protein [Vibrio cholerae]EJL6980822.1 hypothetical protein [Vibrio cholerae]EKG0005996.1 hypothetical protein [Vibrio cholerae]